MGKRFKIFIICLEVILCLMAVLLIVRGALGAFRLDLGARGLFIPLDIIFGGMIPFIAVLTYDLYERYIFD